MANMSYVRFENTLRDLGDCRNALEEMRDGSQKPLRDSELRCAKLLAKECLEFLLLLAEEVNVGEKTLDDLDDSNGEDFVAAVDEFQDHAEINEAAGEEG